MIVIGLRDAPMLKACLESIGETVRDVTYEVIVILNDPTPRLSAEIENGVVGARVFPFRSNLGFGGAVNFAAERARGGYLVLLNDDCVVQRGWLESLVDTEQRRDRCAVVGSTYLNHDGTLQEAGALLWSDGTTDAVGAGAPAGHMAFERRVDYSSGGSLLIRKDVWDELDGFDESYYPAYFEDVDFSLRVVEAGWEVWYQPLSAVRHARSASTAVDFRQFLFRRARDTFVNRWSPLLETREPKGAEERALWKAMGEPIRVLVIDDQIPVPSLGSGFGRMFDTLSMLEREPDIHVAFYPSTQLRPLPGFFALRAVRVIDDLETHLATNGVDYDVVVISRPHNGELTRELLARHLPNAHVIYDAESLFHRRLLLQAGVEIDSARRDVLLAEAERVKAREYLVVKAADSIVCISELEAEELREVTDAPVRVVAPWFEAPIPSPAGFEHRADIGFVAGWAAGPGSPNADGLRWFVGEVMPKVRASVPGCRLLVTGINPPEDVNWLAGSVVHFVGGVRELPVYYNQVRVIISPTRFGAGVKLKTVEAVQYGVPVVCTEEAATGLEGALRSAVWVAKDAAAFADAVIVLLTDQPTWERQRQLTFEQHDDSSIQQLGVGLWPTIIRSACSLVKEAEVAR